MLSAQQTVLLMSFTFHIFLGHGLSPVFWPFDLSRAHPSWLVVGPRFISLQRTRRLRTHRLCAQLLHHPCSTSSCRASFLFRGASNNILCDTPRSLLLSFFSCGNFESNACSLTPLAFPLALASYLFIYNTFFDQVRHCKHAIMILMLLVRLVMEKCAESFYGCIMTTFFANNVVNLCINFFVNGQRGHGLESCSIFGWLLYALMQSSYHNCVDQLDIYSGTIGENNNNIFRWCNEGRKELLGKRSRIRWDKTLKDVFFSVYGEWNRFAKTCHKNVMSLL